MAYLLIFGGGAVVLILVAIGFKQPRGSALRSRTERKALEEFAENLASRLDAVKFDGPIQAHPQWVVRVGEDLCMAIITLYPDKLKVHWHGDDDRMYSALSVAGMSQQARQDIIDWLANVHLVAH